MSEPSRAVQAAADVMAWWHHETGRCNHISYVRECSNPGGDWWPLVVGRIAAEDAEFGMSIDPCEHPSVNGGVCAVCGAVVAALAEEPSPEELTGELADRLRHAIGQAERGELHPYEPGHYDELEEDPTPLCALCGQPAKGYATVDVDGHTVRLCHEDRWVLPWPSCYERWTVYGERPAPSPEGDADDIEAVAWVVTRTLDEDIDPDEPATTDYAIARAVLAVLRERGWHR